MKILIPIIISIFLLFTVSAIDVSIDKTDYSFGEKVTIAISSCPKTSLILVSNPLNQLVYIQQGTGNWQTEYNTYSDSSVGKYSLRTNCADGTSQTKLFCVNSPTCLTDEEVQPVDTVPDITNFTWFNITFNEYYDKYIDTKEYFLISINESDDDEYDMYKNELKDLRSDIKQFRSNLREFIHILELDRQNNLVELNNSEMIEDNATYLIKEIKVLYTNTSLVIDQDNESTNCTEDWLCSNTWSPCNPVTDERIRSCIDRNECSPDRTEKQDCTIGSSSNSFPETCTESWSCSSWSTCYGETQTRTCQDSNNCGTLTQIPSEEQLCTQEVVPEPLPMERPQEVSPPVIPKNESNTIIILVVAVIGTFILILGIILYFFFFKKGNVPSEIKMYIKKNKARGISDGTIKSALLRAGWKERDVKKGFK
ncbi:hypothetical protein HOL21_04455 [Candidatus Woesearchaeota archaeon]|jgi:hypothetical protein|nr:hypothetical protein [Candidatus Woesearchaeota archaeon]MBT5397439.1 hypothetical protein [Candidatus Woesearchaeota archaeon]MBT6367474.1 hypothetical protein [Candidatus Woesearchaeota archaeon]MBT7762839.1 hypothetical protein [Candidatus Woesearchaeota archaeon]